MHKRKTGSGQRLAAASVRRPGKASPHRHAETSRQRRVILMAVAGSCLLASLAGAYLWNRHQAGSRETALALGTAMVRFDPEPASTVTVAYDPATDTVTSQALTDDRGYTWTFSLPGGALAKKTDLTLTPATSLRGTGPHDLVSGLSIAPAGLRFAKPPTLQVRAPDGTRGFVQLYLARPDGSGLHYAAASQQDIEVQLYVSGLAAVGVEKKTPIPDEEIGRLVAHLEVAEAVTITEIVPLPAPPEQALHCSDEVIATANGPAFQTFVAAASQPELETAERLRGAYVRTDSMGLVDARTRSRYDAVMGRLAGRVNTRLGTAFKSNQHRPETFAALAAAALASQPLVSLVGRSDALPVNREIISWAASLADQLMPGVSQQHAVTALPELSYYHSAMTNLGGEGTALLAAIQRQFTFGLRVNEDYIYDALGVVGMAGGEVAVTPTRLTFGDIALYGEGELTNRPNYGSTNTFINQARATFPVAMKIALADLCSRRHIGVVQSAYAAPGADAVPAGYRGAEDILGHLFQTYIVPLSADKAGTFQVAAKTGSPLVGRQTWTERFDAPNLGPARLTLTYELWHKPR